MRLDEPLSTGQGGAEVQARGVAPLDRPALWFGLRPFGRTVPRFALDTTRAA